MKTVSEKNKKGAKLVKVSAFVITAMRYILIRRTLMLKKDNILETLISLVTVIFQVHSIIK